MLQIDMAIISKVTNLNCNLFGGCRSRPRFDQIVDCHIIPSHVGRRCVRNGDVHSTNKQEKCTNKQEKCFISMF